MPVISSFSELFNFRKEVEKKSIDVDEWGGGGGWRDDLCDGLKVQGSKGCDGCCNKEPCRKAID